MFFFAFGIQILRSFGIKINYSYEKIAKQILPLLAKHGTKIKFLIHCFIYIIHIWTELCILCKNSTRPAYLERPKTIQWPYVVEVCTVITKFRTIYSCVNITGIKYNQYLLYVNYYIYNHRNLFIKFMQVIVQT